MNVSCSECGSVFRVDPAKIPQAGIRARCSVCGGVIAIGEHGAIDEDFIAPPERPPRREPSAASAPSAPPVSPAPRPVPLPTPPMLSHARASVESPIPSGRPAAPMPPAPPPAAPRPGAAATGPAQPARSAPPAQPAPSTPPVRPAQGVSPMSATTPPRPAPRVPAPPAVPAAMQSPPAAPPTPASTPSTPPSGGAPAPATRPPINPFLANDPNQKAKRLARALVSDIIAYFPEKHREGLQNGTLRELFREEIKKSYEEYVEQMGKDFAASTTHFQDALNDVLAGGKQVF